MRMNLEKKHIQAALNTITLPGDGKPLMDSGTVKNIVVFGDEVVIDLTLQNPSLQARKKLEVEILKCIHKEVHPKAKIKTNITVQAPAKNEPIKETLSLALKISLLSPQGKEEWENLL